MSGTTTIERIIASKAARGKFLFQSEYAEMPYHLGLTMQQWDTFEAKRDEIRTWLTERGMFCEFVSSKQSKRRAAQDVLDLFNKNCLEYNDAAFEAVIAEYTSNPMQNVGLLTAYKTQRMNAQKRFFSDQPSGINLGFLTENDAMEFRLRWI